MIIISENLSIDENELTFTNSRSGGPGGQNVNKVNTRVTLWMPVEGSKSLTQEQQQALLEGLATRINKRGMLWIVSSRFRTQAANRQATLDRLVEILQDVFKPVKTRKKTRMPMAARVKRLENKTHRSRIKKARRQDHHGVE